jgi:hypothetical protein
MSNDIFKAISQAAGSSRSRKSEGEKWNNAALKNAVINLVTLRDGKRLVSAKKDQNRTLNASTTCKTVCVLLKRGVTPEVIAHYAATEDGLPAISERFDYSGIFAGAGGVAETLAAVAEQEGVEADKLATVLGVEVPAAKPAKPAKAAKSRRSAKSKDETKAA